MNSLLTKVSLSLYDALDIMYKGNYLSPLFLIRNCSLLNALIVSNTARVIVLLYT